MRPSKSAGRPINCRSQSSATSSSSVEAGEVRQSIPFASKAAASSSPQTPGAGGEGAEEAKNEGWFQGVMAGAPGRSTSARNSAIGSPLRGGEAGSFERSSPG